ncbi:hypothetical protein ASPACDRAFT_47751 [Aspergillus aculeatus ATCC 16872]|uniref:Uncharacterized protein n=1 Tax=Aspergillus aculeatus (strain ATCC 16872 / CBS 172.66 / WB 5094) TaxID=690307 RepID=A0A1L9WH16_ASPA1|nr:uncharacterized protein ASPACDRAFT_47751 [Aspergillus aculeatus ATCC 16872]OJJ95397.1 hypothetical protein ASPACDRAFT_47751 [Aspergillus aculeatus ATCC 16872]
MATLNPSQTHPQNLTTTSPASSVPQPPNPLNLAAAAAMAVTSTSASTTSTNPSQHPTEPHQTHYHHHHHHQQHHLDPSTHTDNYPHQITGSGGPTATAPFLRDFSLVAEAAKRAQMSVMVRDLESVTL